MQADKRPGDIPIEAGRLLRDPAPQRIEQAAIWHLARALNIGRVIAFVGAGVPMAYGRISWKGLVETLADQVERDCTDYIRDLPHTDTDRLQLQDLLDRIVAMRKEDAGADQYPTLFQLAELLDNALAAANNKAPGNLRTILAANIFDDRGQCKELFRRAFGAPNRSESSSLEDFITRWFGPDSAYDTSRGTLDSASTNRPALQYRSLFSLTNLRSLVAAANEELHERQPEVLPLLLALAKANAATNASDRAPLIATHRFAITALLRLIVGPTQSINEVVNRLPSTTAPAVSYLASSRSDSIPAARDPLLILHERLRIDRFLTTNYDLDIERLFRDLGFVDDIADRNWTNATEVHGRRRTDRLEPLGGRSRDLVLDEHGHGRLLDFATQDRRGRPQIVHLHGRATLADGDRVVVTEQDYQALYQRDGVDRHPMDVARSVTFGGNPLLFVGLGMGEDDILRPLRQFMGQESRIGDRLAVAIMPGTKRSGTRLLEQMTLLNRYGYMVCITGPRP
jgi:SIR2-like domain